MHDNSQQPLPMVCNLQVLSPGPLVFSCNCDLQFLCSQILRATGQTISKSTLVSVTIKITLNAFYTLSAIYSFTKYLFYSFARISNLIGLHLYIYIYLYF